MTTTRWLDDHFIAGNVALDFANTIYRRWPEPGPDLLTGTDALTTWLLHAGLLPTDVPANVTAADLDDARALRALLWRCFDARTESRDIPADAFVGLLGTARRFPASLTIRPDGSSSPRDTPGAFALVALSAVVLALQPPPQGVRACDRCGWFLIDSSRGRRRRWCSMKTCGNQAKAARYRSAHA